jgi:peptidoglycan biosynthesis protein MviN/MurJ (putative lipid II flippase)
MIPMTAALLVFGDTLVNFVYGRGAFDSLAIVETTRCLLGYAIGLVASVMVLLLAPAFYAKKDFKTPLKASLISVAANLLLNFIFVEAFHLGSASVAFATSIAAFINGAYLFSALSKEEAKEERRVMDQATALLAWKVILCAAFSGISTAVVSYFLMGTTPALFFLGEPQTVFPQDFFSQLLHVGVSGILFGALFFVYARIMKISDVAELLRLTK